MVQIPINVGIGPAGFVLNAPASAGQSLYYGLKLDVAAIIGRQTIARYRNQIPARYQQAAAGLGASLEVPLSSSFHFELGWDEQAYVPQALGGAITDLGTANTSLWLIGEPYFELDFRFPYTTNL